jgi:hypothetical protein
VKKSLKKPLKIILICVICAAVVVVAGCGVWNYGRHRQWWGQTDLLQELKASPLADERAVGYRQMKTAQSEPVGFARLQRPDFYDIWYAPGSQDAFVAKEQVIAFARTNGFSQDSSTSTDHYTNLSKTMPDGHVMVASVRVAQAGDPLFTAEVEGMILVQLYYSS